MIFANGLEQGTLIKRYKRFLADIVTQEGKEITIHCPNTGSMKNCMDEGSTVWYSRSKNPKRKYPNTWEFVKSGGEHIIGINTGLANSLVAEALENEKIKELKGFSSTRREVKYGDQNSRIDFLLSHGDANKKSCYVEVKNVSLHIGRGQGLFPDAVSERGQKHLQELMTMVKLGNRAVLLFCVQHSAIQVVSPADEIDAQYGKLLREAAAAGVEVIAYGADFKLSNAEVVLLNSIRVNLD